MDRMVQAKAYCPTFRTPLAFTRPPTNGTLGVLRAQGHGDAHLPFPEIVLKSPLKSSMQA